MKRKHLLTVGILMCALSLCACGEKDEKRDRKTSNRQKTEASVSFIEETPAPTAEVPDVSSGENLQDNEYFDSLIRENSEQLLNYAALKMNYPDSYGNTDVLDDNVITTIIGYTYSYGSLTEEELNKYAQQLFGRTIDVSSLDESDDFYVNDEGEVEFNIGDWGMSYPEIVAQTVSYDNDRAYVTNSVLMYDSENDEYVGDAKDYTITYTYDENTGNAVIVKFEISNDSSYKTTVGSNDSQSDITLYKDFLDGKVDAKYAGHTTQRMAADDYKTVYTDGEYDDSEIGFAYIDMNDDGKDELVYDVRNSQNQLMYVITEKDGELECIYCMESHNMRQGAQVSQNGYIIETLADPEEVSVLKYNGYSFEIVTQGKEYEDVSSYDEGTLKYDYIYNN